MKKNKSGWINLGYTLTSHNHGEKVDEASIEPYGCDVEDMHVVDRDILRRSIAPPSAARGESQRGTDAPKNTRITNKISLTRTASFHSKKGRMRSIDLISKTWATVITGNVTKRRILN